MTEAELEEILLYMTSHTVLLLLVIVHVAGWKSSISYTREHYDSIYQQYNFIHHRLPCIILFSSTINP